MTDMIYFSNTVDPETGDTKLELTTKQLEYHSLAEQFIDFRRTAHEHGLKQVSDPAHGDPTLAVFYDPPDQGDG